MVTALLQRGNTASVTAWWQVVWQKVKHRRRLFVALAVAWIASYLRGVRCIRLHSGKAGDAELSNVRKRDRMAQIIKRCPSLAKKHWPPWFAPEAHLLFGLCFLKNIRARLLQRRPYHREVLALRDGVKIALDWVRPELIVTCKHGNKLPVCVLLHGAFEDSCRYGILDLMRDLAACGLQSVIMNRRGYAGMSISGEAPKLAMFGNDEDLDDVLAAVNLREPGRPVAIVGFSCGAEFAGRYPGKRPHLSAWELPDNSMEVALVAAKLPRILCSVAYAPGYDVSDTGALSHMRPPISWAVGILMKYYYVFRHRRELMKRSASFWNHVGSILDPRIGHIKTWLMLSRLHCEGGWKESIRLQQPVIHELCVPSLLINSRDDPVCSWKNVEKSWEQIESNPNLVLADFARGSHGCNFDFWGRSNVVNPIIGEFVKSTWEEWLRFEDKLAGA